MSILLYESYALQRQKLAPARVKDTERTLTISLAAGVGTIISAKARDHATMTEITKAYPGQEIGLDANVKNDGDKATIWLTGKDKDTGTIIKRKDGTPLDYSVILDHEKTMSAYHGPVIMPNKNFNILLEAGHG